MLELTLFISPRLPIYFIFLHLSVFFFLRFLCSSAAAAGESRRSFHAAAVFGSLNEARKTGEGRFIKTSFYVRNWWSSLLAHLIVKLVEKCEAFFALDEGDDDPKRGSSSTSPRPPPESVEESKKQELGPKSSSILGSFSSATSSSPSFSRGERVNWTNFRVMLNWRAGLPGRERIPRTFSVIDCCGEFHK